MLSVFHDINAITPKRDEVVSREGIWDRVYGHIALGMRIFHIRINLHRQMTDQLLRTDERT